MPTELTLPDFNTQRCAQWNVKGLISLIRLSMIFCILALNEVLHIIAYFSKFSINYYVKILLDHIVQEISPV